MQYEIYLNFIFWTEIIWEQTSNLGERYVIVNYEAIYNIAIIVSLCTI